MKKEKFKLPLVLISNYELVLVANQLSVKYPNISTGFYFNGSFPIYDKLK